MQRAWCTEIWRTRCVTHPSLAQYLVRKSVGMWQAPGGSSALCAGFGWSSKWGVCKKERTFSVQVWQSKGVGRSPSCCVTRGKQGIGKWPPQHFFSPAVVVSTRSNWESLPEDLGLQTSAYFLILRLSHTVILHPRSKTLKDVQFFFLPSLFPPNVSEISHSVLWHEAHFHSPYPSAGIPGPQPA